MQFITHLLFRRMRLPLIVLISTYAFAILGFVLIPGMDNEGNAWRMDFFHSIYFVSFLGSTIGLGEIPYPFNDAQRMWATLTIYTTVLAWLYAIGSVLALVQDQAFRRVLKTSSITRRIKRIHEPFYLICGYGDASNFLVNELSAHGIRCVVVDTDENKILRLEVEQLPQDVTGLCADVTQTETLLSAGLRHPRCKAVIAITGNDHVNLTVAINSKLLAPALTVICQSNSDDARENMISFGTDHTIDPYELFASRFAMMFHSPSLYLVYEWITAIQHQPLTEFIQPPQGNWLLCGFGRFGKSIRAQLETEGVETTIIEADMSGTSAPQGCIEGRGTEAVTLLAADIENAAGVIAGTDNDSNNLSILITAHDLNKALFMVGRQNFQNNDAIFKAAHLNMVMHPGTITAKNILGLILAPLTEDFLRLTHDMDEEWANILVSRVAGMVDESAVETWDLEIGPLTAPAVFDCLIRQEAVTLGNICADVREESRLLPCIPLLIKRDEEYLLLPELNEPLQANDRVLFCGHDRTANKMRNLVHDHHTLHFIRTGTERPSSMFGLWLAKLQG